MGSGGGLVFGIMVAIVGCLWVFDRCLVFCRDEVSRFRKDADTRRVRFVMMYLPHIVEAVLFAVFLPVLAISVLGNAAGIESLFSGGFVVGSCIGLGMLVTSLWQGGGRYLVRRGMAPRTKPAWQVERERWFKGFGR